jgi:uncharacterized protein (DUF58 family)
MALQDRGVPTLLVIPLIQLIVLLILFVALLYGQRDLALLTILMLCFVGGAWLWTKASLFGLTCHSLVDKAKCFPGAKLTYVITAENKKILPIWLQLLIPINGQLHASAGEKTLTREGCLLWFQRAHFQWELTASRRGVHQIGPPRILAGDLFAFFYRKIKSTEQHQILVDPRTFPLPAFSLPRRDFFGIPGAKSPVQDPIFLLGTRDYQHGRPAKYIHWKASARRNSLQEKVLEPTQQEKVLLIVNVTQFQRRKAAEDFEKILEMAASLASQFNQRGLSLGLVTNGKLAGGGASSVPVARNNQQLSLIMENLARLEMKSRVTINEALDSGTALMWGLSCVYFCYRDDETLDVMAEYFRQCRTPVVFLVCHPRSADGQDRFPSTRNVHWIEEMYVKEKVQP